MKKTMVFFTLFLLMLPSLAHEFWLQPAHFVYQPGETIHVRFWVGEDFDGSNWSGNRQKINSLHLWLDDLKDDIADQVSDEKGDSLQLTLFDEVTAMITFNSVNSYIALDATKFNAYLKEDGLTGALDYRNAHHETDSAGREFYQRSVKTLLQAGNKKTNVSRATGLPLDIIPLSNPYALKNEDSLSVTLLFRNKPLANHLVNVWHRVNGSTTRQRFQTNNKGGLRLAVLTTGKWMVSAVQMLHLDNQPPASWQSYWGSCTWGYE